MILKEISMAAHKYMNIPPQHTINALSFQIYMQCSDKRQALINFYIGYVAMTM